VGRAKRDGGTQGLLVKGVHSETSMVIAATTVLVLMLMLFFGVIQRFG